MIVRIRENFEVNIIVYNSKNSLCYIRRCTTANLEKNVRLYASRWLLCLKRITFGSECCYCYTNHIFHPL